MSHPSKNIESVLVENRVFPPDARATQGARISGMAAYEALCKEAEEDFEGFWSRQATTHLQWSKPFSRILDESNAPFYQWFGDGELNASANCLDRHIGTPVENKTAIVFEADDGTVTKVSYKELLARVSQFANALKAQGMKKGDRVIVYMPMTVEGVIAMQACARIGAVHSVVFGGFSAKALQERIIDAGAAAVITANFQLRGGKQLPLKAIVDDGIALGGCESIKTVFVYERTRPPWNRVELRDKTSRMRWPASAAIVARPRVNAEHPLFLLYTSGSTGKPKGVQHASGGYLLWAKMTNWTFDMPRGRVLVHRRHRLDHGSHLRRLRPARGRRHAGGVRGRAHLPDAGRFWQMIEKHKVSVFYTAPTAIRSLIKAAEGDEQVHPKNWDLTSLRILGSVGEPINPEAWMWYHRNIGGERCPIVDTFWQTETGGHVITPLPGATPLVPGSCTLPLPGIMAAIVDETGKDLPNGAGGMLVIKRPWPSMIRTIWNDPERFKKSYFPPRWAARSTWRATVRCAVRIAATSHHGPHRRRAQCVGPPLGTMEIESALVSKTDLVAEAAVVGRPGRRDGRGGVRLRGAQARAPDRRGGQPDRHRVAQLGGQGDRPDRQAQGHPLRRQPAQDAQRQDHAAAAAQHRQGRGDHAGHLDAREPGDPGAVVADELIADAPDQRSPAFELGLLRLGVFVLFVQIDTVCQKNTNQINALREQRF
jgi:acetyl-CoA synthetase